MKNALQLGFIGAGNMGSALMRAISRKTTHILLSDHTPEKAQQLASNLGITAGSNEEIAQSCHVIFLAVKPQALKSAMDEIREALVQRKNHGEAPVLVTMAAGVTIASLQKMLGEACPVIRIMPNTPVAVGQGVILYAYEGVEAALLSDFLELMSPAGALVELPEKQIDAASAVSGCGPAFVYLFLHGMAMGGVRCGLKYDTALKLAAQTAAGAASMVLETGEDPETLKVKVCSPAGTTIEGVKALEDKAFVGNMMEAVSAAYRRTLELADK